MMYYHYCLPTAVNSIIVVTVFLFGFSFFSYSATATAFTALPSSSSSASSVIIIGHRQMNNGGVNNNNHDNRNKIVDPFIQQRRMSSSFSSRSFNRKSDLLRIISRGGSRGGESEPETTTGATNPSEAASAAVAPIPAVSSLSPIPFFGETIVAVLTTLGRCYSRQLEVHPILTKSYTAGFIFGISDFCAQLIEGSSSSNQDDGLSSSGSNSIDWTRTISSTLVGLLYFGPAAHYWYEWIFQLLPSTTLLSTLHKAVWGQVLFGPSFTCIFFATSLLQSGDFSLSNWFKKIKSDLPGAWLAGIGYWPIVDIFSYSIVPVKWIPLFVNVASFIWTIYLSLIANKKDALTGIN